MSEFRCSACGGTKTGVTDVRPISAFKIRRRRRCEKCGFRFVTIELPAEEYALLDIADGSVIAQLRQYSKQVTETIDAMIKQQGEAE